MKTLALLLWLVSSAAAAETGGIDRDIGEFADLFFDLQLDGAAAAADRLKAAYPGHPAGDFYHSAVLHQRLLMQDRKDVDALKVYEGFSARCVASAEAYRSKDPAAAELYLSAAHGMHARVLAPEKRYREAIEEGLKGIAHLKLAIKLRPERDDSYLGLGLFNYLMSRVPAAARPFAFFIVGSWGNRDLGLLQLERAADKGVATKMEARIILSAIYSSEKEQLWDKAEALLSELMERYPHNPVLRLRRVFVSERRGQYDLALRLADPAGSWLAALPAEVRERARASARYRAAESLLLSGKAREAGPHLDALLSAPVSDRLRAWSALRRGNWHQARGERAQAEDIYRALARGEASREAKEFRSNPYPGGPKAIMPFDDALGLIR